MIGRPIENHPAVLTSAPTPPILDWMQDLVDSGAIWTQEHAEHIRRHLRKVDELATEMVERARAEGAKRGS